MTSFEESPINKHQCRIVSRSGPQSEPCYEQGTQCECRYHSWVGFEAQRDELFKICREGVIADDKAEKECDANGWSVIGSIISEMNYYCHNTP